MFENVRAYNKRLYILCLQLVYMQTFLYIYIHIEKKKQLGIRINYSSFFRIPL